MPSIGRTRRRKVRPVEDTPPELPVITPSAPAEPAPSEWETVTATPATFAAVLAAAAPETIIYLQTGSYGVLTIPAGTQKAAPGVSIRPGAGQSPVLTGVKFAGTSASHVTGVAVEGFSGANKVYGPTTKYLLHRTYAERCHFRDGELCGEVLPTTVLNSSWQGVLDTDCTDCSITGSLVHDCRIGIGSGRMVDWVVTGNTVYNTRNDAIRGTQVNGGLIENNDIYDLFNTGSTHIDGIQFYCNDGPSSDITIRRNRIRRGAGAAMQGIFMRGLATNGYTNVVIEENAILGGHQYNGIKLSFCDTYTVDGNFVQAYELVDGNIHTHTRIDVTDCTGTGSISDNRHSFASIINGRNTPTPTMTGNVVIAKATPGDETAWQAFIDGLD